MISRRRRIALRGPQRPAQGDRGPQPNLDGKPPGGTRLSPCRVWVPSARNGGPRLDREGGVRVETKRLAKYEPGDASGIVEKIDAVVGFAK